MLGHDENRPEAEGPLTCSAKGCAAEAAWALLWNNPKLHTEDRRKTWLACDQHRSSLGDFLSARGFLRDVQPVAGPPEESSPEESSPET